MVAAAASASPSGQLGLHITGDLHGKYALLVSVATNIDTWTRDGEATGIRSSIANGERIRGLLPSFPPPPLS